MTSPSEGEAVEIDKTLPETQEKEVVESTGLTSQELADIDAADEDD